MRVVVAHRAVDLAGSLTPRDSVARAREPMHDICHLLAQRRGGSRLAMRAGEHRRSRQRVRQVTQPLDDGIERGQQHVGTSVPDHQAVAQVVDVLGGAWGGGYGRGDFFFKGENPPAGALIHYFLKAKPAASATMEISDITGALRTTFILDGADAGVNRQVWDLRFDPPASTAKGIADNLKKQIDGALLRKDVTDENKAILTNAAKLLEQFGTNFRKVIEIQATVLPIIGRGMFAGGGGMRRGGGVNAEPGIYVVKLTVGGKTYTGKVAVRLDPIADGKKD